MKLEFSGLHQPAGHWRDEIVEWRLQLEKLLTRSILAKLDLPARYRVALKLAGRLERDAPGFLNRVPAECLYTMEQIISIGDEDWFPETGGDRHSGAQAPCANPEAKNTSRKT